MKWNNLGTYSFDSLGTWTWDTLDNFPFGYEQIFTTPENVSANFLAENAKLTGAMPNYKVFIECENGTIDLEFADHNRLTGNISISKNLERLFNETEISAISIEVANEDNYFNPLGTGLFSISSVYNRPIKVWKGFKYGWGSGTLGTAEYIPAFTGYIDNLQNQDTGIALINCRDKGKLFINNTSEKTTQTGTAGGAYWNNENISDNVAHLIEQSCQYGTGYEIEKTIVVDSAGAYHFTLDEYESFGANEYGNQMTFLNGTYFFCTGGTVVSYIAQGTYKKELEVTGGGIFNLLNDGTRIYALANIECFKWENGTIGTLDRNCFSNNAVYYNNYIYTGTRLNGPAAGTTLLHKYNVLTGSYGTCNTDLVRDITTALIGLDDVNGNLLIITDCYNGNVGGAGTLSGTVITYRYPLSTELGTKTSTNEGAMLNHTPFIDCKQKITFNKGQNKFIYIYEALDYLLGYRSFLGTKGYPLTNLRSYDITNDYQETYGQTMGSNTPGECWQAIESYGTNVYACTGYSGTWDVASRLFIGTIKLAFGTAGTVDPKHHTIRGILFNPSYVANGTQQERLLMKGMGYATTSPASSGGTNIISQYSPEYNLTIGTFDAGSDKVADVLQTLAEASNYVQYIDEGGVYHFRRRNSGTTVNWNFGTNDILSVQLIEGDGVSQSPIINKAVWGTNTGTVSYEDLPSQGTYGVNSYQLNNKWITGASIASDICYGLVQEFSYPKKIVSAEMRWLPLVRLFDVVTLDYTNQGLDSSKKWQVIGLNETESPSKTSLVLKEITI